MKGLIEEGSEILQEEGDESVIDAGIIVAAQKVEHYEIAGYGSVRTFAELLGKNKSAELLQTTERRIRDVSARLRSASIPTASTQTSAPRPFVISRITSTEFRTNFLSAKFLTRESS